MSASPVPLVRLPSTPPEPVVRMLPSTSDWRQVHTDEMNVHIYLDKSMDTLFNGIEDLGKGHQELERSLEGLASDFRVLPSDLSDLFIHEIEDLLKEENKSHLYGFAVALSRFQASQVRRGVSSDGMSSASDSEETLTRQDGWFLAKMFASLRKTPPAHWFLYPVDPIALNIPDYPSIITNPVDIQTMMQKLRRDEYSTFQELVDDFDLMVSNCITYNGAAHEASHDALLLKKDFDGRLKEYLNEKESAKRGVKKSTTDERTGYSSSTYSDIDGLPSASSSQNYELPSSEASYAGHEDTTCFDEGCVENLLHAFLDLILKAVNITLPGLDSYLSLRPTHDIFTLAYGPQTVTSITDGSIVWGFRTRPKRSPVPAILVLECKKNYMTMQSDQSKPSYAITQIVGEMLAALQHRVRISAGRAQNLGPDDLIIYGIAMQNSSIQLVKLTAPVQYMADLERGELQTGVTVQVGQRWRIENARRRTAAVTWLGRLFYALSRPDAEE